MQIVVRVAYRDHEHQPHLFIALPAVVDALTGNADSHTGFAHCGALGMWNGDAKADYRGFGLASPSLKGSSGILEIGYRVKPSKKLPLTLDINVAGWVGQQKGVTGQIGLTYNF